MEIKVQIVGNVNEKEVDSDFEQVVEGELKKVKTNSFGGLDVFVYILSIGGGVIITEVARVLVKMLGRDKVHEVKINGVSIKGFSYEQTKELLKEIYANEESLLKGKGKKNGKG